jgi:hypothetical protein
MYVFDTYGMWEVAHENDHTLIALSCILTAAITWYGFIKLLTGKSPSDHRATD